MSAAVADYTPADGARSRKIEKGGDFHLDLVPTVDILAELGRWRGDRHHPVLVGFAAQTGDVEAAARRKLLSKGVDLVVANDVSAPGAGFEVTTNQVTLVSSAGSEPLPLMSKDEVAGIVMDRVEQALAKESVVPAQA
jgi:phosphopantothenoylcysteine decarboxylase/phosphopantothenate--cysteine ligase